MNTTINILDYIPKGKQNALSCRKIADKIGYEMRDIRGMISRARADGAVICSINDSTGNGGYFIPLNVTEVQEYITTEEKKIETLQKTLIPAKNYIKENMGTYERKSIL